MLHEYAVEPAAIAEDWKTCRYLCEKFGYDRGRLLSLFPKRWLPLAIEAAGDLKPVEKLKVIEGLKQLKDRASMKSGRPYDDQLGTWLDNAIAQHGDKPFHAIIAQENPPNHAAVLESADIDEAMPLMAIAPDRAVPRDEASISGALDFLLRQSSRILFVDPFFDPYSAKYRRTLQACLRIVKDNNPAASCEIHYRFHPDKPANSQLETEAANLFPGTVPEGLEVKIFCWREINGGEDFHDRYLLSEKGGIAIGAGYSAEGANQTTNMHLMSSVLSRRRYDSFASDAGIYALEGPILLVSSTGAVRRL